RPAAQPRDALRLEQVRFVLAELRDERTCAPFAFLEPPLGLTARAHVEAHADEAFAPVEYHAAPSKEVGMRRAVLGDERRFDRGLACGEHLADARLDERAVVASEEVERVHAGDLVAAVAGHVFE